MNSSFIQPILDFSPLFSGFLIISVPFLFSHHFYAVLVVRDGNIGAKLKFDVSTMNDFVKNIEVPPKLGLVHQKSFERIVGKAYSFNPDLSGDPVWFMKLSRMLEPDEGYVY